MSRHLPQRKSPRLKGYDYSQAGAYFITICTYLRQSHFGEVVDSVMQLSELGDLANSELSMLSGRWDSIDVDYFVVMPNHVHVILMNSRSTEITINNVVGGYKAGVTRLARKQGLVEDGFPLWQGRFHDHIIRDEQDLHRLRRYIVENPARWLQDTFYKL